MPASVKRRLDAIPQLRYPLGVTGVWFEAPLKLRYHFACNRMSVEFVNEIIGLLSTDGGSITEALLKTKVLLFDIGHEELVEWVKDELGGYNSGKIVPAYRIVPARVLGNLVNMRMRATSHPIPLNHLSEDERDALESIHVRKSLSTIAEFVNANPESDTLRRPLPLEFNSILSTGLSQGTHLEQAWCAISKFNMGNVIFQVKSRLLDFMLELKQTSSFTNRDTVSAKRSVPFDAVSSFNNAIFGSNTTIVIGNNKIGSISNQIATGDFSKSGRPIEITRSR